VKINTIRYVKLFEEAAESLLPARTTVSQELDIFDFLQVGFETVFLERFHCTAHTGAKETWAD
jgi:hypothetical protein